MGSDPDKRGWSMSAHTVLFSSAKVGAAKVARPQRVRCAALSGTGSALPARVFANDDFPASLCTSDEWIRTRTGIRERRIAGSDETSFTLGLQASRRALAASGLAPGDIDLIVFATVTPDTMVPSNAC